MAVIHRLWPRNCGPAFARMAVARCGTRSLLLLLVLLLGGGPTAAKRRSRSGAPQSETSREAEPASPAGASSSSDAPAGEAAAFVLEDWLKEKENECTL